MPLRSVAQVLSILGVSVLAAVGSAEAQTAPTPAPTSSPSVTVTPGPTVGNSAAPAGESAYDFHMRFGYAAAKQEDYGTAALHFRNALFERPNDQDATLAYWNSWSAIQDRADGQTSDSPRTDYDRHMEIGYDATESGDYQTALINFRRALEERPEDRYASQAIINVQTYINRGKDADQQELATMPNVYPGELAYDRYLRLGYAAAQREDFRMAASYFRSALYERPNDRQATIAYWNAVDVLKGGKREQAGSGTESAYDRAMRLGYDATERQSYQKAQQYFEKALAERPGDKYAAQALRNVKTYLEAISQG